MKSARVIRIALSLSLLSGSIPYSYAYCMMMKRALDAGMEQCLMQRSPGPGSPQGVQVMIPVHTAMRIVSKPTIDAYEHLPPTQDVQSFTLFTLPDFRAIQSARPDRPCRLEPEHPPPDIVIEILNLRI